MSVAHFRSELLTKDLMVFFILFKKGLWRRTLVGKDFPHLLMKANRVVNSALAV